MQTPCQPRFSRETALNQFNKPSNYVYIVIICTMNVCRKPRTACQTAAGCWDVRSTVIGPLLSRLNHERYWRQMPNSANAPFSFSLTHAQV